MGGENKIKKTTTQHCLGVDTSGHGANGYALGAVKKSLEEFSGLYDFKVTAIIGDGDAGGGVSIHNVRPALVEANRG